jgi:hypothetical protein
METTKSTAKTAIATEWSQSLGRFAVPVTVHAGIAPVVAVYMVGAKHWGDFGEGATAPVSADFYADAVGAGVPEVAE